MYIVTKKLRSFSAAHRLVKGYQGKCQHLHGHSYNIDVELSAHELDQFGFVMDFDEIKLHFDQWVQTHWDHATIVSELDQPLINFLQKENQHYFVIPGERNTTAECLAEFLYQKFNDILTSLPTKNVSIHAVRVHESVTACATFVAS